MSETTNLKLKKHDNPETNTEKFDIENYLNGNWDKIDKNVGEVNTDISNINSKNKEQDTNIEQLQENTETSSNKIAELEKELKEAQEDFYQNSIRGQASGEYIHVEDSSGARCKIGISGNHEQETRNGKNKIEITKTTTTVNGCTHTIKDGTDTLSGTSSTNWANLIIYSFVGDGKTYTLSGSPSTSKNIFISAHDNVQKKDLATSKNGSTGTFVATSGNSIDIIICVAPNLTLANELFKPQLEEGSTATEWEQYGASPSPNYLSEIKTVGDNVNLFPGWESGTVDVTSGEKRADPWYIRCKDFIPIVYGVFYTISQINSVNFNSINCSIRLYDKDKKYLGSQYVGDILKQSLTFTVNNLNVKYIIPTATNGKTVPQNAKTDIKLEKGTVATSYSSHGQGNVKITKYNKNLAQDVKYTNQKNKYNGIIIATYTLKKGQKYYFSFDTDNSGLQVYRQTEKGLGLKNASAYSFTCDGKRKTFSAVAIENKTIRASIIIRLSDSSDTVISLSNFMISTYEDATYEENQEQTYIMPTQAEMLQGDYFDFDNEEEVHVWNKQILTGNEKVMCSLAPSEEASKKYKTVYLAVTLDTAGEEKLYKTGNVMSNMFKNLYNPSQIWGNDAEYAVEESIALQTKLRLRINKSRLIGYSDDLSLDAKAELFKAYLKAQYDAGTPVMIYYKQATPTRLKFTDEQKAVAKELNNARTYKNVTNITTDSKAILSLDYVKDQETQNQKMQNEIDEIKQLLSTTQTSAMLLDNLQKEVESEVE